ncbi:hypothetical protein SDC9_173128 [bioreactor metagenome]|uniref:Uncharacterized protein n=1 Tax=bioreactor metagenome TaxID=1076179 RepID=A0A645GP35_9ZZZZ
MLLDKCSLAGQEKAPPFPVLGLGDQPGKVPFRKFGVGVRQDDGVTSDRENLSDPAAHVTRAHQSNGVDGHEVASLLKRLRSLIAPTPARRRCLDLHAGQQSVVGR